MPQQSSNRIARSGFSIGAGLWAAVYSYIAPRGLGVDGFLFKDPGVNWAQGNGFVWVASPCVPNLTPEFPAFPSPHAYLYALHCLLFGVSDYANVFFDLALWTLRSWLLLEVLLYALPESALRVKLLLTGFILAFLPFTPNFDRPEELSMALFFISALCLLRLTSPYKVFAAFLIAGLNAMTLQYGGLLNLAYLFALSIPEQLYGKGGRGNASPDWTALFHPSFLFQVALGTLLIPVVMTGIFLSIDPASIDKFLIGAFNPETFGSLSQQNYYLNTLAFIIGVGWFSIIGWATYLAIAVISVAFLAAHFNGDEPRLLMGLYAGTIAGVCIATVIFFPSKYYYAWFAAVCTLAFFACAIRGSALRFRHRIAVLVSITALLAAVGLPRVVRGAYARFVTRDAYFQAVVTAAELCRSIPEDVYIAASPRAYFLFKAHHWRTCDINDLQQEFEKIGCVVGQGVRWAERADSLHTLPLVFSPDAFRPVHLTPSETWQPFLSNPFLRTDDMWEFDFYARK